jgi:methyl coenzyme M reductase subunit C-like uncharacterized protein (methanogenesis marker protein 7)
MFHISTRSTALVSVVRVLVRPFASSLHSVCSVNRYSRSSGWASNCGRIHSTRGAHQPISSMEASDKAIISTHIQRTLAMIRARDFSAI